MRSERSGRIYEGIKPRKKKEREKIYWKGGSDERAE